MCRPQVPPSIVPSTSSPSRMSHNPYCPHLLQNRTPSLLPKLLYIIFGFGKMEGTHSETKDISFSDRSKKTATNSTTESSAYIWTLCGGNNMSVLTEIGNWEKETPLIERVLLNNMWIGHRTPPIPVLGGTLTFSPGSHQGAHDTNSYLLLLTGSDT